MKKVLMSIMVAIISFVLIGGTVSSAQQVDVDSKYTSEEELKEYYRTLVKSSKEQSIDSEDDIEIYDRTKDPIAVEHYRIVDMVEEAIAKHVKYDTSATENISKNIEFILESVNSKIFIADKDTLREYIERSNMYIPEDKYEKVNVFIGEKLFTASDENAAISSKVYSGYDRVDAVNYALQYCGTYLAGTNSAGYNTSSYPVYSSTSNADADCANFVSQCLKAGGMQEVGSDYTRADNWFCNTTSNTNLPAVALTWRGAVYFPKYWETRNVGYNEIDTSTVNLYSDYEDDVYDVLNRGDVVQLCDDDYRPIHTLIITSYSYSGAVPDLLYSAHTVNRKNQPLQGAFYGYDTVRFYRFYN